MELLILSFLGGVLTVLAPCILPLLPVIIGGSIRPDTKPRPLRPYIITGSLVVSIVVFSALLKAGTLLINIPESTWAMVSGAIIILFGVVTLFPHLWESLAAKLGLNTRANKALGKGAQKDGALGDVLIGAALGPVFTSCSPTYGIILATILPVSFAKGLGYMAVFALGLALVLLAIALGGQSLVQKLGWASDPKGVFKRVLGVIFILVGIFVFTGWSKDVERYLVDQGLYDGLVRFEQNLR